MKTIDGINPESLQILHNLQIRHAFELGKKFPRLSFEEAVQAERRQMMSQLAQKEESSIREEGFKKRLLRTT